VFFIVDNSVFTLFFGIDIRCDELAQCLWSGSDSIGCGQFCYM